MSYYVCPHCGERENIFDHGGAKQAANQLGVPFLGEIPLNAKLRVFADEGTVEKSFSAVDDSVHAAIRGMVQSVAAQVSIQVARNAAQPTLTVE
jgi:ATP-binding protein involved in chromosome partitioning